VRLRQGKAQELAESAQARVRHSADSQRPGPATTIGKTDAEATTRSHEKN